MVAKQLILQETNSSTLVANTFILKKGTPNSSVPICFGANKYPVIHNSKIMNMIWMTFSHEGNRWITIQRVQASWASSVLVILKFTFPMKSFWWCLSEFCTTQVHIGDEDHWFLTLLMLYPFNSFPGCSDPPNIKFCYCYESHDKYVYSDRLRRLLWKGRLTPRGLWPTGWEPLV